MSIKKALFGGSVETSATASYQGSIQDGLPVKNIIGGVVITKDNRFIKILEIVPVNIYLKSAEDRQARYRHAFHLSLKREGICLPISR